MGLKSSLIRGLLYCPLCPHPSRPSWCLIPSPYHSPLTPFSIQGGLILAQGITGLNKQRQCCSNKGGGGNGVWFNEQWAQARSTMFIVSVASWVIISRSSIIIIIPTYFISLNKTYFEHYRRIFSKHTKKNREQFPCNFRLNTPNFRLFGLAKEGPHTYMVYNMLVVLFSSLSEH